jgi:hypothetical protein
MVKTTKLLIMTIIIDGLKQNKEDGASTISALKDINAISSQELLNE